MKCWYAVQTQPHLESKAVHHLNNQGFPTFFPRYRKERRHARRVDTVEAPLFPGYVFVALDLAADRWRAVLSTLGVRRLVTFGGNPAAVPDVIMNEIRARANEHGLVETMDDDLKFSPGEALEILTGPFKSYIGLFAERDDQNRVILLLNLLGRTLRLPIAAHAVQPSS
jgi:transcriptional antiterminator RfaH